tara:strand:- start:114487 stop:114756 length:270 start_codon:yes stop_codon:yes gene_type:complete
MIVINRFSATSRNGASKVIEHVPNMFADCPPWDDLGFYNELITINPINIVAALFKNRVCCTTDSPYRFLARHQTLRFLGSLIKKIKKPG